MLLICHICRLCLFSVVVSGGCGNRENFLVEYLQVLYAEAVIQQNLQLVIQIQETIRCLQRFSNHGYVRQLQNYAK